MTKQRNKFWAFHNSASPGHGELYLYGPIDSETWWGDEITPQQFKDDLDALGDVSVIDVYINSPGGDVFAGQAIHSMLQRHPAQIVVHIDGLAASIASVIAMAGDTIIMPRNAMMMIHNPSIFLFGGYDADDMKQMATSLDQIRLSLVGAYQNKVDLSQDEIIAIMEAETWLTADEAVAQGFADQLEDTKQVAASLQGGKLVLNGQEMDFTPYAYKRTPRIVSERSASVIHVPNVRNGVVPPDVSDKLAPKDTAWTKPTLADFTDKPWADLTDAEKRNIAGHFAWAAEMPPATYGDLKLPHHRPSDGDVVWNGVANCAARLPDTDIPDEDIPKVQAELGKHYKQFGETPPWEEDDKSNNRACTSSTNKGRALSSANEEMIAQARDLLNAVLANVEDDPDEDDPDNNLSLFERRLKNTERRLVK